MESNLISQNIQQSRLRGNVHEGTMPLRFLLQYIMGFRPGRSTGVIGVADTSSRVGIRGF
jgi:hypothetical protein